jgi:hypothetical protein
LTSASQVAKISDMSHRLGMKMQNLKVKSPPFALKSDFH